MAFFEDFIIDSDSECALCNLPDENGNDRKLHFFTFKGVVFEKKKIPGYLWGCFP